MNKDHKWIDEWYIELEKGLSTPGRKYKRPKDWLERMLNINETVRKPVRNQYEGRRRVYHEEY